MQSYVLETLMPLTEFLDASKCTENHMTPGYEVTVLLESRRSRDEGCNGAN